MRNENLKSNLHTLELRFPGIGEQLTASEDEQESKQALAISIEAARNGAVTAKAGGKYLHSRFDPAREARRLIEKELPADCRLTIFEGFGLGYQVEALLESRNDALAIVLEPSTHRFLTALSARPMEELLSNENLSLVVGAQADAIPALLSRFPETTPQTFRLRPLYDADPESFVDYDNALRHFLGRKQVNNATLDRFAGTWTRNLLRNVGPLAEAGDLALLRGKFSHLPALLLAAGPSLDELLDRFEEIKEKVLVIAVDTACRALTLRDIRPDILVVVDPQYWNTRHLDHAKLDETVMVSESSTHPRIFRLRPRRLFFCGSMFPLGIRLESAVGRNAHITAGGSVSTTAFSLARFMGVEELYISGLDLGYPGGSTHFRGSFFEQRGHSFSGRFSPFEHFTHRIIHEAGREEIPTYNGTKIASDSRLSVYRSWFAEQVAAETLPRVYALSGNSAAIKGIEAADIDSLLRLPNIGEEKRRLLALLPQRTEAEIAERRRALEDATNELAAELRHLAGISAKAALLSRSIEKAAGQEKTVSYTVELLNELDRQILSTTSKDIAAFLIQPFLRDFSLHDSSDRGSSLYQAISEAAEGYLAFFHS
ncbi:protein of unknown function DUF115 [Sediminispirochaeta smaragdinae DSM 11293]|uniref:6-hydroxymethylpterin diphosphokinase MptE-like domain-containing protein n=2 Tax=Sediminispirochaeta TaxID=1911556 RepID=E1R4J8_SEDSS|nr:protein of unknown function DUF115 [Sediminispirochaeta smaragdinae DSM 11293]